MGLLLTKSNPDYTMFEPIGISKPIPLIVTDKTELIKGLLGRGLPGFKFWENIEYQDEGDRTSYPPRPNLSAATTTPPKVYDLKFYSEYMDPEDDFHWNQDKILFSFTFDEEESETKSPAYEFLISMTDLDTGVKKCFVQKADTDIYRFWQRQAEAYTESPLDETIDISASSIVNSKITVIPINDFGEGKESVFFLPFKDLVWTRAKSNSSEGTFNILKKYWHLYSEEPEKRLNRPKVLYIYLDTPPEDIEEDVIKLSSEEYSYETLSNYKNINQKTFRYSVSGDEFLYLTDSGWLEMTKERKEFVTDLIQTMLPAYRDFITGAELNMAEPNMFKMAVENPRDNRDTVIIYLIKGQRWRP